MKTATHHRSLGLLAGAALMMFTSLADAQATEHVVKSGETLFGLARQYQTTVDQLRQENKLTEQSVIKVGQTLRIPGQAGPTSAPQATTPLATREITVVRGDTLFGLARTHGTTVATLRSLNTLPADGSIRVGQVLRVPQSSTAVVARPDTPAAPSQPSPDPVQIPEKTNAVAQNRPVGTLLEQEKLPPDAQNLQWPVAGEVYRMAGKFPGVAIKARAGETVRNLVEGRVIYTGPHSTLGTVVFVQGENGYIYVYGGNNSSLVRSGVGVKAGEAIATLGAGPGNGEPQGFFTVWKDGAYLDPLSAPR